MKINDQVQCNEKISDLQLELIGKVFQDSRKPLLSFKIVSVTGTTAINKRKYNVIWAININDEQWDFEPQLLDDIGTYMDKMKSLCYQFKTNTLRQHYYTFVVLPDHCNTDSSSISSSNLSWQFERNVIDKLLESEQEFNECVRYLLVTLQNSFNQSKSMEEINFAAVKALSYYSRNVIL